MTNVRGVGIVGLLGVMLAGVFAPGIAPRAQGATPATTGEYSASQLYNAANAYARSGQTALAVLAYERARVLAPRDADVRANLHRVRESAGLPDGTGGWLEEYGRFVNPNIGYALGVVGLLLAGICLLAARRRKRSRGILIVATLVGVAAVAASAFNAAATFGVMSESVALHPSAAGVSPVAGADSLFQVAAASMVRVLDRHGAFRLIRDSQGREGWVAAADLAAVVPDPLDPRP